MASTVIYQKRGDDKVKIMETPDLSPYAIKADVDAELANKADAEDLGITNKRVDTIESLLNGAISTQQIDSTSAYSKTVPAKAQPYAAIDAIGGKTLCWNQLLPTTLDDWIVNSTYGTSTHNTDGSISYNITTSATSASFYIPAEAADTFIKKGHKYYLAFDIIPQGTSVRFGYNANQAGTEWYNLTVGTRAFLTKIWEPTADETAKTKYLYPSWAGNTTGTSILYSAKVIDLTLMFGAGNEPSTVAEVQAMFPTISPAYDAGSLKSAAVTGAVSNGRNLLPPAYITDSTNKRGLTVTTDNNGSYKISGTASSSGYVTFYFGSDYTLPAGKYALYARNSSTSGQVSFTFAMNVAGMAVVMTLDDAKTSVTLSDATFSSVAFYVNSGNTFDLEIHPSIEYLGDASLPASSPAFTPYRAPATLPIPSAVQQLPGYGLSTLNKHNPVDFVSKKFTENCHRVSVEGDLIELYWNGNKATQLDTNKSITFRVNVYDAGFAVMSGESDYFINNKSLTSQGVASGQGDKIGYYGTAGSIYVCLSLATLGMSSITSADSDATILAALKTALATYGLEFVYNLATPVETDISSLLSDDNLIAVEPGGTISFPSTLGDSYRIPVPSQEEYTIDLAPAVPTTDGTYTLTATVADGVATYSWESA